MGDPDIDIEHVVVIGEYTTNVGPFADDHFLVLVRSTGETMEIPTEKAKDIIAKLENYLSVKIEYGLCNSTDLASRIIFPDHLAGLPLFDFTRTKKSGWYYLLHPFTREFILSLTPSAKSCLART